MTKPIFLIISAVFVIGLSSCGSGSHIVLFTATSPYKVEARHNIEDEDEDILIDGTGALDDQGGTLFVRSVEKKLKMIEHYNDTLAVDWSVPLTTTAYEGWIPVISHKNGNWYCLGLDKYDDGDSIAVRTVTIDGNTHKIISDVRNCPQENDHYTVFHSPKRSPLSESSSPDLNTYVFYSMDKPEKTINIHCHIFDFSGKLLSEPELSIPIPEKYESTDFTHDGGYPLSNSKYGLLGLAIDNNKNLYAIIRSSYEAISVLKYASGSSTPEKLTATFPSKEFSTDDYWVTTQYAHFRPNATILEIAGSHQNIHKHIKMEDLTFASFDFTAKQVKSFQYKPEGKALDKLIDQSDLDYFSTSNLIYDPTTSRQFFFVEKREGGISTTTATYYSPATNHTGSRSLDWSSMSFQDAMNYSRGMACFAFDADGKPAFQLSLPKKAGSTRSDFFISDPNQSKITIYYTERDTLPAGLYVSSLDLSNGSLTTPHSILQFNGDSYIFAGQTLWQDKRNAILFASGEKRYHGGWRNGFPSILKLKQE
jgi:hypothetical protein